MYYFYFMVTYQSSYKEPYFFVLLLTIALAHPFFCWSHIFVHLYLLHLSLPSSTLPLILKPSSVYGAVVAAHFLNSYGIFYA